MPCFGKKKSIVPVDEDAVGRLEGDGAKNPRDGLSSAPTSQDKKQTDSARKVHSAPNTKKGGSDGTGKAAKNEPISDFILEATDGSEPTAESVDAYLADVIGSNIVKDLRSNEWAARVSGLEDLKKLVSKRAADDALVATGGGRESPVAAERLQLFRACVTVITKALNDKVVPVFLPALALLSEVYSPRFIAPISDSKLPRTAIACFAEKLVFRAGSSNVRAREESSSALMALARCDAVGCLAVAPHALSKLSDTKAKSISAAVGRLELLRALVAEFSVGDASGLNLSDVLSFALPLCECASKDSRDAAIGLILDVRMILPQKTEKLVEEMRPSVLPTLKAKLAPPADKSSLAGGAAANNSLSLTGKPLKLQPLAPISLPGAMPSALPTLGDDGKEELIAFHAGTPPEANQRARARTTATELGVRQAPPPRPKMRKRPSNLTRKPSEQEEEDNLLAEMGEVLGANSPQPVRLAAGNAGVSPSKYTVKGGATVLEQGTRAPLSPLVGAENQPGDEVTFLSRSSLVDMEAEMEQILEMSK